nr:hypothetical protein [uncultured Carboxylicivirga sp.]
MKRVVVIDDLFVSVVYNYNNWSVKIEKFCLEIEEFKYQFRNCYLLILNRLDIKRVDLAIF